MSENNTFFGCSHSVVFTFYKTLPPHKKWTSCLRCCEPLRVRMKFRVDIISHGSRSSYYKLSAIALHKFDLSDAADGLVHDNTTITTLLITTYTSVKYPYEQLLQDTCDNLNPLACTGSHLSMLQQGRCQMHQHARLIAEVTSSH